jgi:hypothetical protein
MIKNKSGQEEIIGFALIVVIVAVIILIFISFSLTRPQKEPVESYEIENFIQSLLQYTTDCEDNLEHLSMQKLIISCFESDYCKNKKSACEVLNKTLFGILKTSWNIGEENPVKGYFLNISSKTEKIISLKEGNITKNYKWSTQSLGKKNIEINFIAYY